MNIPIPFPIKSPRPIAARLMPSRAGSKGLVTNASNTAPNARPPPPISKMRFSRWSRVRSTARGRGEGSIPRPPGALPSCRARRRDTVLLRPCPRRFRDWNRVRTNRSRQVLVDEGVVDPGAERPANERHSGRHPEVEVLARNRVRAIPDDEPPDPRTEVTRGIQGRHLDRGKQADQGGNDEADRDRRQVGRRGHTVFNDAEDADHQDRGDDDLGSGAPPPGILGQVIAGVTDQPRVRPIRPEDQPARHAVRVAAHDLVGGLVVDDDPVPDKRNANRRDERADELRTDVARYLRPWETAAPREAQRNRRVQMRPGNRAARIDGEGDREPPEKSRPQQAGLEAIAACPRYGEGDEAIAEKNQNEGSQHFGQVLFSPAFGYRHYFLLSIN